MYKKLFPLTVLFFTIFSSLRGQVLTPDELREDFDLMADSIRAYQMTLPVYGHEEEFEAAYARLYEELDEPMTLTTFYGYLLQLMATTGEAHNWVGRSFDPGHHEFLNGETATTPFSVKVFEGKLHVGIDYTATGVLPKGAELLSINGASCEDIKQQMMMYCVSDGAIVPHRERLIEIYWGRWFPWFFDASEAYEVVYAHPDDGREDRVTVSAITFTQMGENLRARGLASTRPKFSKKDVYDLQIEDDYAVLTLKTFDHQNFKKAGLSRVRFYTPLFLKIIASGVSHLVIDVRGNQGGPYHLASDFLPYVVDEAYTGELIRRGSYLEGEPDEMRVPEVSSKKFEGEIYVLVDSFSVSGGAVAAKYLYELADATVIGTEPGSRYQGFASGFGHFFQLPNSGYHVTVADSWSEFPYSQRQNTQDRGLIPDYEVTLTAQQWIAGEDPVMEKALALIRER